MKNIWKVCATMVRRGGWGSIAAASAVTLYLPVSASTSEREFSDEQVANFEQRMRETRERLKLSDEQVTSLKPILRDSAQKRAKILESYGFDLEGDRQSGQRPGFRELRSMRSEMEEVREETEDSVEEFLNDDQMDEYLEIAEERREEIRARIREAR